MTEALLPFLFVAGGVVFLYFGADWLVRGAATLGTRLGVPSIVVGLTVVSLGTSAPELVVSILAAFQGSPDIAIGNVLGSNLANVGLILGIGALIRPMRVARGVLRRDIPWMLAITILVFPLLVDLNVGRVEGAVLCAALLAYLLVLVGPARRGRAKQKAARVREAARAEEADRAAKAAGTAEADRTRDTAEPGMVTGAGGAAGGALGSRPLPAEGARGVVIPLLLVALGSGALALGGRGVVTGAISIASAFEIPELIVGLSIVAVGTSLPELAAVVMAALREEADLALGNVVGSNLFNLTLVLGGTALVHPIPIQPRVIWIDLPVVLFLSTLLLPLAYFRRDVGRLDGALFLLLYAGAWWLLVMA